MKKLNSASFEKIIADYNEKLDVGTMAALFEAFETLGSTIMKYFINKKLGRIFKKRETVRELICVSFIKLPRYNPAKGRAFNYFTTIMLGWLRQVYRTKRNYAELKAKYEKATNSTNPRKKLHCS